MWFFYATVYIIALSEAFYSAVTGKIATWSNTRAIGRGSITELPNIVIFTVLALGMVYSVSVWLALGTPMPYMYIVEFGFGFYTMFQLWPIVRLSVAELASTSDAQEEYKTPVYERLEATPAEPFGKVISTTTRPGTENSDDACRWAVGPSGDPERDAAVRATVAELKSAWTWKIMPLGNTLFTVGILLFCSVWKMNAVALQKVGAVPFLPTGVPTAAPTAVPTAPTSAPTAPWPTLHPTSETAAPSPGPTGVEPTRGPSFGPTPGTVTGAPSVPGEAGPV